MENALPAAPNIKFKHHSVMLASGSILQNRYRIVRQLGKGGMGAVYEAVDQRLDAIVALKETFSVDERLRRQFEQEARLLAQLHHPALPRVSDYFTEDDRAFLVMQYIAGVDLAEIVATQPGPLPRNQVIAWADQLLDALVYLHTRDRQIVHRDIKPHNLKVTANGQIALLDFGLAKAQTTDASGNTSTSVFGYTRRYSPLEQIQDQGTTPQSDIYALGATLYHLLTGIKPPDALTRAAALGNSQPDPLRPANEVHRAVGTEIAAILNRAMALSPEGRYPTANDFRGALRQVGRREMPTAQANANQSDTETSNELTSDGSVGKERVATIDPFDSYSILKPAENSWAIPKQSGRTGLIAAAIAIVLVIVVGAFYDPGHWIDSPASVLDHARATPGNSSSGTTALHQNPENSRARPPVVNNAVTNSSAETSRRAETQKRRVSHSDIARTKPPSVRPPRISIAP